MEGVFHAKFIIHLHDPPRSFLFINTFVCSPGSKIQFVVKKDVTEDSIICIACCYVRSPGRRLVAMMDFTDGSVE